MLRALFIYSIFLCLIYSKPVKAQWAQDFSNLMEISDVSAMEASSAHLYVLSEVDGMSVFRIKKDSLTWLYTSSGMQRRGNILKTDIRFGYLYGDSRKLTVLEPTNVLGVFSSTQLPVPPLGVARLDNQLYIALNNEGLGVLSLSDPDIFDSKPTIINNDIIGRAAVIDVESSILAQQLFVLTNDNHIHVFKQLEGNLAHSSSLTLRKKIDAIFIQDSMIWGVSNSGEIFSITTNGIEKKLGNVNHKIQKIIQIDASIIVRTEKEQLWISESGAPFTLWQKEPSAGNFIAKSDDTAWVSFFNKISPLISATPTPHNKTKVSSNLDYKIKKIDAQILTFPQPLILGLELEYGNINDITFTVKSKANNAKIRKQGLIWRPTINDIGITPFTIIATNSTGKVDSTRFIVDVRTFNAPPRFSPVKGSTIAMNEPFEITFKAIDPEKTSSTLIRYLGVDLPEGSTLNERTGLFTWTPTERQLGEHTFTMVATDEQGTASSIEVTYSVINLSRGE